MNLYLPIPAVCGRTAAVVRAATFALLLGATLPLAAQTGSSKFIQTFLVYYGGGPRLVAGDAQKMAKFDLIDTNKHRYDEIAPNTWAAIKAFNPNIGIYLYEDGTEASNFMDTWSPIATYGSGRYNVSRGHSMGSLNGNNPGLFLLDSAGNRIYNPAYSSVANNTFFYLMDFGSAAYQAYFREVVTADFINQPWVADGVHSDNCLTILSAGSYSAAPSKYPTDAIWSGAMNTFASGIAAGLHASGQKLWCNRGATDQPGGAAAWLALDSAPNTPDVVAEEGAFAVMWGSSATQFYPEAKWKSQLDVLSQIQHSKVALFSHTNLAEGQSGTDNWGKPVTFVQSLWYALGSFLLGKNDVLNNAYFAFTSGTNYDSIQWYNEYDHIDLGKALGPYAVTTIGSANVYWREFEKGYVYVNATGTDVASLTLPQALQQLTRDNLLSPLSSIPSVTSIALNAHNAAILLKTVIVPPVIDTVAPSTPTGLLASAVSSSQINLSWTASTDNVGVTGYRVYRAGTLMATLGAVTNYQNTGLSVSTSYSYTVQAIDAAGNASAQSASASATTQAAPDTIAPSVPTGLTGTAVSSTQINLTWNPSTDNVAVASYQVYLNDALMANTTVTSFQHTGLTPGTTYNYRVSAADAVPNYSAWTATPVSVTTPAAADTVAPSTPTGLLASAVSSSQINLSWSASTDNVGVTGYRVYRAGALLATLGAVTSYQNTGLTASTTYSYTVQAVDAAGNASAQSVSASATTQAAADTVAPSTPTGLSASAVSSSLINLSWAASTDNVGVTGYRVYRAGALLATLGAVSIYQNTGLTASTTYSYTVQAVDAAGNASAQSVSANATTQADADTIAPSVPADLTATAVSPTQINLSWSASTDNVGVTGYRVYRAGALLVTLGAVTSYQNTGLTASTTYSYTVQAVDAAGNASAQSNSASATTQAAADTVAPSTPTGLLASAVSSSQINLSWTASTDNVGVTGYRVYRAGTLLATLGAVTSYQNTGLTASTTYSYTVQAVDAAGNASAQSNSASATTQAAPDTQAPSVPTGLKGRAVSRTQINLTWNASNDNVGVTGYYVYLNGVALATTTTTSFQHTGLTAGTTYNYRVSAYDAVPNHSAWTAPVSVRTTRRRIIGRDFNGDGKSDILWRNNTSGQNAIWLMNGTTVSSNAAIPTVTDLNWSIVGAGDFDGDGKSDILWRNRATGEDVIWIMNGTTLTRGGQLPTAGDLDWSIVGVGDFDGNGKSDILWRHRTTGENAIWLVNGTGMVGGGLLPTQADLNWGIAGVGDFDGDGKSDILWRNRATGENSIWLVNGTTMAGGGLLPAVTDLTWSIVGVGDFDGDGKSDILWRNNATGENMIWLVNGTTLSSSVQIATQGDLNWGIAGVGDFDGDGKPDILWRNSTTGQDAIWLMNGTTFSSSVSIDTVPGSDWSIAPR